MSLICSTARKFFAAISLIPFATEVYAADMSSAPVATTGFVSMLQVLLGLGLVLGAIAGTAWILKRLAPGQVAASGALRVVGGVAVGPKERVVLVDVGDTRLVLGVGPGSINKLMEIPRPNDELVPSSKFESGIFYKKLKDILSANSRGGA